MSDPAPLNSSTSVTPPTYRKSTQSTTTPATTAWTYIVASEPSLMARHISAVARNTTFVPVSGTLLAIVFRTFTIGSKIRIPGGELVLAPPHSFDHLSQGSVVVADKCWSVVDSINDA